MTRPKQFLALAGLTTIEVLRQPVSLLLFVTALVLMGLSPLVLLHNFGESGKIVRDGALAAHMLLGFMLAGYSACSVMAREIRTGTASAVLSKPVDRIVFYLAKYAGVLLAILFFSICATAGTLLAEKACEKFHLSSRIVGYYMDSTTGTMLLAAPAVACLIGAAINLFRKRPFVSSAFTTLGVLIVLMLVGACFLDERGRLQSFYVLFDWRLLKVSALIFLSLAVTSALALLFSIKMNTVPAMSSLFLIFMLGWMSAYFFGGSIDSSVPAAVMYALVPDLQHFWMADALTNGGTVSGSYMLGAVIYSVLYGSGVLAVGTAVFCNSELK